jgi:hypothetical protein
MAHGGQKAETARGSRQKTPAPTRTQPPISPQTSFRVAPVEAFSRYHPSIEVKLVLADVLYATPPFVDHASTLFDTPVISPLRQNQNVRFRNRLISIEQYFSQL